MKANNGLRSMLRTEQCPVEVSQRLKRRATILDKLRREPSLSLDLMQDIGGCRAVLGSIAEIRRVEQRIKHNRPPLRYSDYIAQPPASGYRGVHIVVRYDEHAIEIQLRTRVMHDCAITVEKLSARPGVDIKADRDHPVHQLMALISEAMACDEEQRPMPPDLHRRTTLCRLAAAPHLERGLG